MIPLVLINDLVFYLLLVVKNYCIDLLFLELDNIDLTEPLLRSDEHLMCYSSILILTPLFNLPHFFGLIFI